MIKIAYIEDDPNFLKFVSDYFISSPEFEFIVGCGSVEDFLAQAKTLKAPDVLLQDIGLPGMSGVEAIRLMKAAFPQMEIIMFSVYDDSERIFKSLCAGASGYLIKSTPFPKIKESIINVYRGEAAMSPSIARKVIQHFRPEPTKKEELSSREMQIIDAMIEGLSYKLIADKLMVSINTIRYHIKNIYRKLQVNSKMEIVAKKIKGEI